MKIALLGTGLMGSRIGLRLLQAGHPLSIWNRTRERAAPLVVAGAVGVSSPAEAVVGADTTIAILADGPAVTSVLFEQGAADAAAAGSMLIDMSSIPPRTAREHAQRLRKRGVGHLDAPVSGGTRGAEEGTLAIMVGGDPDDFERAQPLLSVLGRPVYVGGAGSGALAKLVNQVICGVTIGAVAEGLVLAARGGANQQAVREALYGGFADSRVLHEHGERMIERNFKPGGPVRLHLKDLETALSVAQELETELPLTSLARDLFAALVDHDCGDVDHSAVIREVERRSPG